jgi:hypothetical protein
MKTLILIASVLLFSCSKQKQEPKTIHVSASVFVKAGQSNYTVSYKIGGTVNGTVVSGVSWKSNNGQYIQVGKTFVLNGEQTYQFVTPINAAQNPGLIGVKITTFSAEGYAFTY